MTTDNLITALIVAVLFSVAGFGFAVFGCVDSDRRYSVSETRYSEHMKSHQPQAEAIP